MELEYRKQKREARLLILEKLILARNELITLRMPHTDLDSSIKLMRDKVKASNKKVLKLMVDKKKKNV